MLSEEQLQFAIEDARERHDALAKLIYFTDSQAMLLLSVYSTLGIALASAAAAILATDSSVPDAVAWALIGATAGIVIGAVFCCLAMRSVEVSLPGRGAEFWLWAMDEKVSAKSAFNRYLENLHKESKWNQDINETNSHHLMVAKAMAVLAPPAAAAAGLIAGLFA